MLPSPDPTFRIPKQGPESISDKGRRSLVLRQDFKRKRTEVKECSEERKKEVEKEILKANRKFFKFDEKQAKKKLKMKKKKKN